METWLMRFKRSLYAFLGVIGLLLVSGCGPESTIVPVSGEVIYQGKPIPEAKVMFLSPDSPRTASSLTDAQGRFNLTTFTKGDGAVIGEHKVAISSFSGEAVAKLSNAQQAAIGRGEKIAGLPTSLPARYSSFDKSGIAASVTANGQNHFRFELTD